MNAAPSSSKDLMPSQADQLYSGLEGNDAAMWPRTGPERDAVREQVGRILASSLFKNSKRFPAFIRYTVEHALTSTDPLKERVIGHEVFGRDANYDTGQDPIVRMTAGEVRKRLTQYYSAPEREPEVVVAYQPGSYVPEFSPPSNPAPAIPTAANALEKDSTLQWSTVRSGWWLALIVLAAIASAVWILNRREDRQPSDNRKAAVENALTRFWAPITTPSAPVLLCIGDPSSVSRDADPNEGSEKPEDLTIDKFLRANSVRYTDSVTLALLTGELRARGRSFRIRRPEATEFKDLRDGPVVLIGGFNNPWTLKLSEGLRFTLAADGKGSYVRDRDRPESRDWQPDVPGRLIRNMRQTYGLITRVKDPSTGQAVLAVSGLALGTRAAGECLTDAACLQDAEQMAGGAFDGRNAQIVVSTAVIREDSGAPRVVAVHAW
jgi:hypothetical protein